MNYKKLYEEFPYLESKEIVLKKISDSDAEDLFEIHSNENLYKFKPGVPKKNLQTVANMIGHYERDFNKKKMVFLGVYYENRLVGVAEIFDIDDKVNMLTFGYTLNESYWGRGIATNTTKILLQYFFETLDVNRVQAFVMPENQKSKNVLLRNNFKKEGLIRQGQFWTGRGIIDLELYSILKNEYINSKN